MSEIEKYYNGEIIVDFEEETELEKKYNEVAELYSKAVKKKIEYRKEIERLNNIINDFEEELERESNMKEEDTCLEHNTFIDIKNTLKAVLKRFQEIKGSDKE